MEVKRSDEVSIPCLLHSVSVTMCQVKTDVLFRSSSLLLYEQLFLFRPCRSDSQMAGIMTPESRVQSNCGTCGHCTVHCSFFLFYICYSYNYYCHCCLKICVFAVNVGCLWDVEILAGGRVTWVVFSAQDLPGFYICRL